MRTLRAASVALLASFAGALACSSTSGAGAPTCAQRTADAQSATILAVSQAQADLSCASDSDCTTASDSSICWNSCGALVNSAGAAQIAAAIDQINATTCASFVADGCMPNPAPPCGALQMGCVNGQCTDKLPPLDGVTDAGHD